LPHMSTSVSAYCLHDVISWTNILVVQWFRKWLMM